MSVLTQETVKQVAGELGYTFKNRPSSASASAAITVEPSSPPTVSLRPQETTTTPAAVGGRLSEELVRQGAQAYVARRNQEYTRLIRDISPSDNWSTGEAMDRYIQRVNDAAHKDMKNGAVYDQLLSVLQERKKLYGEFDDAAAYNQAVTEAGRRRRYAGLTYEQVQDALRQLKEKRFRAGANGVHYDDEIDWLENYGLSVGYGDSASYDREIADVKAAIATNQEDFAKIEPSGIREDGYSEEANRVRVLVEKKKELENTKAYLERKKSEAVAKEIFRNIYEPYEQADDFAEESRYDVSVKNKVYRAANLKRVGGSGASNTEKLAAKMEDNEARIYNYLYKTQGQDKASVFLEDMRPLLNQRLNEQHTNFAQTFADKAPVLSDIVTFASQLVDGVVMTPFKAIGGLTGDYEKNWAAYDSLTNFTNTIRTDHAQDLSEWAGSEWAGFVYNTVMSLGDMGVALLASKGVGNVLGAAGTTAASAQTVKQTSDMAKTVTQIIMASEAATQTMTDARARGLSGVQITTLGLASACIESLTEKYSLDALFKNPGNAVRYVLNNAVTEGSEEAVANILNTLMDELMAGDRSIIKSRIGELMADGVSYRDAAQQVFLSKLKELGLDTLAGLFVGGTLSGLNVSFKQVADTKTGVQAEMKTDSGKKPHISIEEFANRESALEIKGTVDDSVIDYGNTGAEGKVNWKNLHPNVKATIAYVTGFATKVAGMDVQLVTNGREYGFTGRYDRQGNTMLVDITALTERVKSADSEGRKDNAKFIISAASHEVTHWMEEKAPELYAQYDKMVMDALTTDGLTEVGVLARRRALLERAEAKRATKENRKPREITDKEVRREVVARASEDMLALSEEGKKFFESLSENEQKTVADKIKEVIQDIKDWIKTVLSKLTSDAPEARELSALAQDLDAISKKWDEMLREAAKVNATMKKAGVNDKAVMESKAGADTQNADIDKYGLKQDNVSRANKQGDFINEFHDALSNREWNGFYTGLKSAGYLADARVGVVAPIVVGDKLVIAKRQYMKEDVHDYVVRDVFRLENYDGNNYFLHLIKEAIEEGDIVYDTRTIHKELHKLLKGAFSSEILARYDGGSLQFVVDIATGKNWADNGEVYGNSRKGVASTGLPLGNQSGGQRDNGLLSKDTQFSDIDSEGNELSVELQEFFKNTKARDENGNLQMVYHGTRDTMESKASDTQNEDIDETNSDLDKAVYNGNKRGVIHGEQKAESRQDFYRRIEEIDGEKLEVRERGQVAFAFARPDVLSQKAQETEQELRRLGVPCIVVDRLEINKDGFTTIWDAEAATARGDAVYVNNALTENPIETAGHEAFHFWGVEESRVAFKEALQDNIDFSSANFKEFVREIQDDYFGDEIEIGGDNWGTFAEEILAHISGRVYAGDLENTVHQFLYDYGAVKSAWDDLVNSHTNKNDVRYEAYRRIVE